MRNISITVALIIVLGGCAQPAKHKSALIGVWKSNAAKTLQSVRSVDGVTEKAKRLFENDFFGHLIVEYREKEARSYFDQDADNIECIKEFYPYQLIEENEELFIVKEHDRLEDGEREVVMRREGDCYYVLFSKWNLREYFCRIDNSIEQ